ncbi:MAG: tRNA (adenosine(37)-N6)-threonylcarbamoyltransferase complex dimerization subunit type 1 TsaB [Elusimicrobiales bacterium]|nr:tRNA (adenosine(37)-N6)-threonylcarbamoyltransferase complex dimerization subunit type 1 TsaB [Elusimicrobiales bacterium]
MKTNHPPLLAVDSSDTPLKLALLCPDGRILRAFSSNIKQEKNLIPLANRLLSKGGLKLGGVKKIFILRGPGRFTGIRIGITFASLLRGLSGARVYSATVLETLARHSAQTPAFRKWSAQNPEGAIAAITYAFREEFFCQLFSLENGALSEADKPRWLSAAELKKYLAGRKNKIFCAGWAGKGAALEPYLPDNCAACAPYKSGVPARFLIEAAGIAREEKGVIAPLYLKPARFELLPAGKAARGV